jgi:hypothetical protein
MATRDNNRRGTWQRAAGVASDEHPLLRNIEFNVPKRNLRDLCSVLSRLRGTKGLKISSDAWISDGRFVCRFPTLAGNSTLHHLAWTATRMWEVAGYLSILPKRLRPVCHKSSQVMSTAHSPMVNMQVASPNLLLLETECRPILAGPMRLKVKMRSPLDAPIDRVVGYEYSIPVHIACKAFGLLFDKAVGSPTSLLVSRSYSRELPRVLKLHRHELSCACSITRRNAAKRLIQRLCG